jgi:hypothetical protein
VVVLGLLLCLQVLVHVESRHRLSLDRERLRRLKLDEAGLRRELTRCCEESRRIEIVRRERVIFDGRAYR